MVCTLSDESVLGYDLALFWWLHLGLAQWLLHSNHGTLDGSIHLALSSDSLLLFSFCMAEDVWAQVWLLHLGGLAHLAQF